MHFRVALPSTAPSIGMRIPIDEGKSRQTVKQRAHLESARATTVSPPLRTATQLASHSHPQHTLPALQFTHSRRHLARQPTQFLNRLGTTTLTPQPSLHNHQSSPPPHGAHTPPPTPNRPTLQPHSNPSGQADSALKTEYTFKLPVVRSQHVESALLPGAAVQQRHSKDTAKTRQRRIKAAICWCSRKGSPRADVALAVQRQPAPLRWDVLRIGGPD